MISSPSFFFISVLSNLTWNYNGTTETSIISLVDHRCWEKMKILGCWWDSSTENNPSSMQSVVGALWFATTDCLNLWQNIGDDMYKILLRVPRNLRDGTIWCIAQVEQYGQYAARRTAVWVDAVLRPSLTGFTDSLWPYTVRLRPRMRWHLGHSNRALIRSRNLTV